MITGLFKFRLMMITVGTLYKYGGTNGHFFFCNFLLLFYRTSTKNDLRYFIFPQTESSTFKSKHSIMKISDMIQSAKTVAKRSWKRKASAEVGAPKKKARLPQLYYHKSLFPPQGELLKSQPRCHKLKKFFLHLYWMKFHHQTEALLSQQI